MGTRGFLLVDANVLVDYQSADLTILSLVSRHVGPVHIVSTVLAEVDGLDDHGISTQAGQRQDIVDELVHQLGRLPYILKVLAPLFVEAGAVVFQERQREPIDAAKGRAEIVRDGGAEGLQLLVGGLGSLLGGQQLPVELVRPGDIPSDG